jgi:ribonucleoside-triphosphate reductase
LTRIKASANWDKKVSGGAILHINVDNQFEDEERSWDLVNMIANSGVIYFAFNSKISVCENKHAFIGDKCPICGKPKIDEYVRIVGYLVPVSAFNKTRKEVEYPSRKFYKVSNNSLSEKEKLNLKISY